MNASPNISPQSATLGPNAMWTTASRICLLAIRFLVGGTLLVAGLGKMRDPFLFLAQAYDYQLVGPTVGLLITILLPATEVIVGGCLLFCLFLPGSFAVAMILSLIMLFAMSSALVRHLGITCGCFSGADVGKIGYDTIFRSLILLIACVAGFLMTRTHRISHWKRFCERSADSIITQTQ